MITEEEILNVLKQNFPLSTVNRTKNYISLQVTGSKGRNRNFVEIRFLNNKIGIGILAKYLNKEEKAKIKIKPQTFGWTIDGEVMIETLDDLYAVMSMIQKSYEGVNQTVSTLENESESMATIQEKLFAEWANQKKIQRGKKITDWESIVGKTEWLRGAANNEDFKKNIDYMPIRELLLKITNLSEEEKVQLNDLPDNFFSLTKEQFIQKEKVITDICKLHKTELKGIIDSTNLSGKRTWSYSTFKPTAFSIEYLDFLGKSNDLMTGALSEYAQKLVSSKNIIFRGAPGTGKTYLARKIAAEIISQQRTQDFLELTEEERQRFEFVQFHPSYDYTDFVEGLRPVNDETNSQIGFELVPGVFKRFVDRAKQSQLIGGSDNFEDTWSKFFEAVTETQNEDEESTYNIKTLTGKDMHLQAYVYRKMEGVGEKGKKGNYYNKDQCYRIYQNKPGVPKGGLDNYRKAIVLHLKEQYGLLDYIPKRQEEKELPHVFVIDEINRGEISKIFGELFFSIDPGYRGEKGAVKTQYASLHVEDEDQFYIPNNVYIIGTMNDIDRSVENFDFAMRRRFRFIEIKSDNPDQLKMLEPLVCYPEALRRLKELNEEITNVEGLNEHYHIGPSYFLKLGELDNNFDFLWEDYLKPLLEEYVRGFFDEQDILLRLRKAYKNELEESEETIDEDNG